MRTELKKRRRPSRVHAIAFLVFVIFGIIVFRLVDIQVLKHNYYTALAESQRFSYQDLVPKRGSILVKEDNHFFPLVANKLYKMLYAVPKEITDNKEEAAEKLASILYDFEKRQEEKIKKSLEETAKLDIEEKKDIGEDKEKELNPKELEAQEKNKKEEIKNNILGRFLKEDDPYEPIMHRLDEEAISEIEKLGIKGFYLQEEEGRFYPESTLAAHILGFIGFEDSKKVGQYGIEGYFNEMMQGKIGSLGLEKDIFGHRISVGFRDIKPAENGADIVLTIDRSTQHLVESKLREGVLKYGAHSGTIIVIEPSSGRILALANYPTFEPNIYQASEDISLFKNQAISDLFEPGSVLKPVIMAMALNENKVTPDTTIVDNGPVKVAKYTIDTYDGKHHGLETMTEILEHSCNVGMVKVGEMLGRETIYDYLRRFGIGDLTGLQISGEVSGHLREPDKWNIANEATVSFGQGIAITPIQLITAISAIANNGVLMKPQIVDSVIKSNGETEKYESKEIRRVISPSKAATLSAMLVSAVENGVGRMAYISGYHIAGKTGTAEVPKPEGGYYPVSEKKIVSFIGYGPVENPRFAILIVLKDPEKVSWASTSAAVMFKEIAEELFKYYKIPPTE